MTTDQIRSEARGAHWIAWVDAGDGQPANGVVIVGQTQAEAEARARTWAARPQAYR